MTTKGAYAQTDSDIYYEPRWTGRCLSLLVHLGLVLFLFISVHWHTKKEMPIEAELWDLSTVQQPIQASPPAPVVPPPVETPKPAPVAQAPEPELKDADIMTHKEQLKHPHKKEKVEPPSKPVVKKQEVRPEPVKPKPVPKPEPKKEPIKEPVKVTPPPPKPVKPKPEVKPKPDTPPLQPSAQDQQQLEQSRLAEVARMGLAASGSSTHQAHAGGGSHLSANYSGKVKSCIKPHIIFNDVGGGSSAIETVIKVTLLPNGHQAARRIAQTSGNDQWDEAALRAVQACDPFPIPDDGVVPDSLNLKLSPLDM